MAGDPRIRGEHESSTSRSRPSPGSSPHTRGAPIDRWDDRVQARIIPAYAGSTTPKLSRRGTSRDHPRIRGEHLRNVIIDAQKAGSSPHTRGAPVPRMPTSASWRDHPRIRGEHRRTPDRRVAPGGSSPHTRGARHARRRRRRRRRIIPAYAGSTCRRRRDDSYCRDHPRIRGEHAPCLGPTGRRTGIIPAYAGSTGWPKHHIKPHPGSSPHTRGARR